VFQGETSQFWHVKFHKILQTLIAEWVAVQCYLNEVLRWQNYGDVFGKAIANVAVIKAQEKFFISVSHLTDLLTYVLGNLAFKEDQFLYGTVKVPYFEEGSKIMGCIF
jgi:hypothetical protein